MQKYYLCIDLKTFYASVECVERGLDPFNTNLVVADPERGKGTICLAISPKMKMLGVKNRCRIFEIPPTIKYIVATPRMKKYIEYSANIYAIYLKYFSKEDIHVYSIDEAFMDVTQYLKLYKLNPIDLAKKIIKDIFKTYGITATAGIGTNMYLAKIALDITAKHNPNNIGYLDEEKYKKELWHHKPLSDFWQIGRGIERRLNKMRIFDMYDIAHTTQKRLYKEFGVNAEYLIDHSWGKESCTIADIKAYKPNIRISNLLVILDTIIVAANVIFFKELEIGLYSAITIYIMGKMLDIFFEGIDFAKIVYIISQKNDEIAEQIEPQIKRGSTSLYRKGMYKKQDREVLFCVASRNEVRELRKIVKDIDSNAFIVITNAREVFGEGFKES